MGEWKDLILDNIAIINPAEKLQKGKIAKKVAMDTLQPFTKKVPGYTLEPYNGGMKFKNGDTIVARITPCFENGKTAYIDILEDDEVGFGSTEYIVIRERKGVSDKHFLYYFAISPDFRDIAILSMSRSSGRQRVQTDFLRNHVFVIPPLPEQRAIASVLSSLDDKIDLLHRQNKTLEAMAETLFRQWFVEEVDEGWEIQPLGKYVVIKRGGSPRPIHDFISDSGYRWLKISDVTNLDSPFIFEIQECIKEEGLQKTVFLKSGSLVLSNSATPGIPKILAVDSCIHDGWLYFPQSYFSKEFLYLLFKYIRPQLLLQGNGSIFTNLKTDILKEFEIPIPAQKTLEQFDDLIKPIFIKLFLNSQQIHTLEQFRDTLLPKLMSGEVRVNV